MAASSIILNGHISATAHTIYLAPIVRSSLRCDFGINRKRVCDLLLVLNSNLGPVLPRFTDRSIRAFVSRNPLFRYHSPILAKISGVPFGANPLC